MNRREFLETAGLGGVGIFLFGLGAAAQEQTAGDVLIRNGQVVTAKRRFEADIRIRAGRISEIGPALSRRGSAEIDATGQLVLPGGIDPHVHLSLPRFYSAGTGGWVDDFESGSRAALAGGITTLGSMSFPGPSENLLETVEREAEVIATQAIADFMLHPVIGTPSWTSLMLSLLGMSPVRDFAQLVAELPRLAEVGQTSIKIFMSFDNFDRSFEGYRAVVRAAREAGLLVMVHCEDAATIAQATRQLVAQGRTGLEHFAESRPVAAEELATKRAVSMCEETGTPLYLVHLSSQRALHVCEEARARGLPVYVETRPLYLHLTRERFLAPDGALYVGQPPLREKQDVAALWRGLALGSIQTVATDHVAWTREQKMDPSLSIEDLRPGVNNLQVMLPMLYSEGVRKQRITLERFVAVTSTNAARLFGLYPRKGTIEVGSDGDLVIWDPEATKTLRGTDVISRAGFSIYEGWEVTGWPRLTLRRGVVVYQDAQVVGQPGTGQLLARARFSDAATGHVAVEDGAVGKAYGHRVSHAHQLGHAIL